MSIIWRKKMPKQYTVEDLPAVATFVSNESCPHLRLRLKHTEEKLNPANGTYERVEGTGVEVRFQSRSLQINNSKLLALMLASKCFRGGAVGFDIDKSDPSGFWRAMGVVKEKIVKTYDLTDSGVIDPKKINVKEIKANLPEEAKPLSTVAGYEQSIANKQATG